MAATATPDVKKYPAICAYFRLNEEMQLGPKELAKVRKNAWKRMSISYPDWMAPYFVLNCTQRKKNGEAPYCTFHNHVAGHGCNKEGCKFVHNCMVCQSPDHGTFFPTKTNYSQCPVVRQQEAECVALQREGFTEEDLHKAWQHSDLKLLFESRSGTTKFVYEKSQLTITGFPRRADMHVHKAPAALVRKQLSDPEIKNAGFISLPGPEEKKNALVFVLYY